MVDSPLGWVSCDGMAAGADGTVTHTRDGADGTAGGLPMTEGKHTITMSIVRSERNRGFLYLGVMAANDRTVGWPARPKVRPGTSTVAWGFCPLNGHLHTASHPSEWGERGRKLIEHDLSGRAEGIRIVLVVDMDARSLSFDVDGRGAVNAHVDLPSVVRLWTVLSHKGDCVRMDNYRGPRCACPASSTPGFKISSGSLLDVALRPSHPIPYCNPSRPPSQPIRYAMPCHAMPPNPTPTPAQVPPHAMPCHPSSHSISHPISHPIPSLYHPYTIPIPSHIPSHIPSRTPSHIPSHISSHSPFHISSHIPSHLISISSHIPSHSVPPHIPSYSIPVHPI